MSKISLELVGGWVKNNWFKILAIIILFGALGQHPYSYYQFLRWIVSTSAFYTAYTFYERERTFWTWAFGIIGVLFNPLIPFYMTRSTWSSFDLIAALFFVAALFVGSHKVHKN